MGSRTVGLLMLFASTCIWGTTLVAQSIGMQHMEPFIFNAVRFLIGGVSVLFVLLGMTFWQTAAEHASPRLNQTKEQIVASMVSGVALFAAVSFQQIGLCTTTVGKAGFITSLYILIVPFFCVVFGQRLRFLVVVCAGVATAGMYLLCIHADVELVKGDIYVFFSAIASAVHILVIGYFSPRVDSVKLSCFQFFVCGSLSAVCAALFEDVNVSAIIDGWAPLAYTGILSCAVAYTLQILGQRVIDAVTASFIFSFEAVIAAVFGWLMLHETLTSREIMGCVIIFVAILAVQFPDRHPNARRVFDNPVT